MTPNILLTLFLLSSTFAELITPAIYYDIPGPIIRLQSTMIVPSESKNGSNGRVQGFWVGMTPTNISVVLQNVVGNLAAAVNDTGEWNLFPEYCCSPNVFLNDDDIVRVFPEDKILSAFEMSDETGVWADNWTVYGLARGSSPGYAVWQPHIYPDQPPFQMAWFAVELVDGAPWDFGDLHFMDIVIEAKTNETAWCTDPVETEHKSPWTIENARASQEGAVTTCCIGSIIMSGL